MFKGNKIITVTIKKSCTELIHITKIARDYIYCSPNTRKDLPGLELNDSLEVSAVLKQQTG